MEVRQNDETGEQHYVGYCIDLLNEIARVIDTPGGFNYTVKTASDGLYGSIDANGVWNGMIGDLLRGVRLVRGASRVSS